MRDTPDLTPPPALGLVERYLTLWVALCMAAGIAVGTLAPGLVRALAAAEIAQVNIPVAALVWAMIVPMLLKVDLSALAAVGRHWRGIGVTLAVNWAFKPFLMAALAWLFVGFLFAPFLPEDQIESYIAGLILLAAAPCTAMVFVWSNLADGEPNFTLSQVALNDVVMVVAFAPIVGILLGLSAVVVPWQTLLLSVVLYIVVPLVVAQLWRRRLVATGRFAAVLAVLNPLSVVALLATIVLLFAFQGDRILADPMIIALLAVPIILQGYLTALVGYLANRVLGEPHEIGTPSALIGASNFFELAVATAISLFGLGSGAALATVVGVLVEVPVMLSLVAIFRRTRGWYAAGLGRGARCS